MLDPSGFSTEPFACRFYTGSLTQAADALETFHFGADAVAYRGQVLLAIDNLPLAATKFKKYPYVACKFVDQDGEAINFGEAFERLAYSPYVGLTADQFETVGITDGVADGGLIIVDQTEFLSLIQQFGRFYPKWSILQTDKLRIVDRGADVTPDIILDNSMLTDKVTINRQEQNSVPSVLELSTIDPGADYAIIPSQALIPRQPVAVTTSRKTDAAYLPVIMDDATRISIVTYTQQHEDRARKQISGTAMVRALQMEPGDLLGIAELSADFPGGETFRVLETTHGQNYAVEFTAESLLQCTVSSLTTAAPRGANFDPSTALRAVVTNRNLSVTGVDPGNGGAFVFVSEAKTSGKYYFEITWVSLAGFLNGGGIGVATTTATVSDVNSHAANTTVMFQANPGNFHGGWIFGAGTDSGWDLNTLIAAGDVIGIAVDLDNRTAWFKNVTQIGAWNGPTAAGDPAANTNGVAIPSGSIIPAVGFGLNNDFYTANFGATSFVGTVPAGFTAGWIV